MSSKIVVVRQSLPRALPAHALRPIQGGRKKSLVQGWEDVVKVLLPPPGNPVSVMQDHDFHVELAAAIHQATRQ